MVENCPRGIKAHAEVLPRNRTLRARRPAHLCLRQQSHGIASDPAKQPVELLARGPRGDGAEELQRIRAPLEFQGPGGRQTLEERLHVRILLGCKRANILPRVVRDVRGTRPRGPMSAGTRCGVAEEGRQRAGAAPAEAQKPHGQAQHARAGAPRGRPLAETQCSPHGAAAPEAAQGLALAAVLRPCGRALSAVDAKLGHPAAFANAFSRSWLKATPASTTEVAIVQHSCQRGTTKNDGACC